MLNFPEKVEPAPILLRERGNIFLGVILRLERGDLYRIAA
jgi:hypothetical protein